jgi:hypothetical protein
VPWDVTSRHPTWFLANYKLPQVKQALNKCQKGQIPFLIGDRDVNLRTPRDERDERIDDASVLADESDFPVDSVLTTTLFFDRPGEMKSQTSSSKNLACVHPGGSPAGFFTSSLSYSTL